MEGNCDATKAAFKNATHHTEAAQGFSAPT